MNDMDDRDVENGEIENIACTISYGIPNSLESLEHITSLVRGCREKDVMSEVKMEYMNLLEAAKKNFLQRLRQAQSDACEFEDLIKTLDDEMREII